MPTSQEKPIAISAIWMVIGPRRTSRSRTVSFRQNDRPKSPCATAAIHWRYWTWSG
jgi:hypothetical protein